VKTDYSCGLIHKGMNPENSDELALEEFTIDAPISCAYSQNGSFALTRRDNRE
jgi:hypothetical protein